MNELSMILDNRNFDTYLKSTQNKAIKYFFHLISSPITSLKPTYTNSKERRNLLKNIKGNKHAGIKLRRNFSQEDRIDKLDQIHNSQGRFRSLCGYLLYLEISIEPVQPIAHARTPHRPKQNAYFQDQAQDIHIRGITFLFIF
mmetsp:Transcript_12349/g.10949  ORF Transcript_12349/g.10949 Transcript_12349/m.10949 type:complete len:143 (-) Transcript_12349:330-758(-)